MTLSTTKESTTVNYLKDYRVPTYFIDEVDLVFDLHETHTTVTSLLRVRHNQLSHDPEKTLTLNGEELILESIKLNGKSLAAHQYQIDKNTLTISAMPDHAELEIVTQIFPQKNTALMGLYVSNQTYCTQCEAEGFRRITYFLDQPDVLAKYTTTIIADEKKYPILLSNGNLVDAGKLAQGRHWVKWKDPFKKPSYLFALVAGDFDLVRDQFKTISGRMIDLRIYVEKGTGDQAHYAIQAVKEAMRWDEKNYGREYDLDIYMIVAIGDFTMGAMENKGLNIFNTKYILAKPENATDEDYMNIASVIAHEYFHNWTGNRVTCRDWFQLSLKEGLTIFRDQSFSEDLFSKSVMRIRDVIDLRETQFPEDAGPLAHSVQPDSYIEINNFYTATIYNKGAEVLRMLKTLLGESVFRRGMDLYFARFDGQAVTIDDYIECMHEVSGIDLKQFKRWYTQAGTPTVTVVGEYHEAQQTYTLTFTQTCLATPNQLEKLPFLIPARIGLLDKEGHEILSEAVLHLKEASQVFTFKNITSVPLPSLFRGFSAPIKLNYHYTDEELFLLAKHDSDAFNRYEAIQCYLLNKLQSAKTDSAGVTALFQYLLQHETQDDFLLAEFLTVPSESYIGEQMAVIDVDGIHAKREGLMKSIAETLQDLFLEKYKQLHAATLQYEFNREAVAKRQLKNKCLSYLLLSPNNMALGKTQFLAALGQNMTDTLPALMGIVNQENAFREEALVIFYDFCKDDALMLDKWFAIQAACKLPDTLQTVKKLMAHPQFDLKNPNKVYALIGTFCHRNRVNFHVKSGEGYRFLREVVEKLDKLNPQVAARMLKPLTTWKRYDKERQALMREQLTILAKQKCSPDLYELITKSV